MYTSLTKRGENILENNLTLENKIFDSFNTMIPFLKTFLDEDAVFGVSNTNTCIKFIGNSKMGLKDFTDKPVNEGTVTYKCIKTGQVQKQITPKNVMGTGMKTIAIPVKDPSGNTIGCLSIGRSLDKQEKIQELSKNLFEALQKISSVIENISSSLQEMASSNLELLKDVESTSKKTENTDEVIRFIQKISSQTNMLGLNASIEASRAGEAGRGFNVVASEIRKLSSLSSDSANTISKVLDDIKKSTLNINLKIDKSNSTFQNQASAIKEITASMQQINATAEILKELSSNF